MPFRDDEKRRAYAREMMRRLRKKRAAEITVTRGLTEPSATVIPEPAANVIPEVEATRSPEERAELIRKAHKRADAARERMIKAENEIVSLVEMPDRYADLSGKLVPGELLARALALSNDRPWTIEEMISDLLEDCIEINDGYFPSRERLEEYARSIISIYGLDREEVTTNPKNHKQLASELRWLAQIILDIAEIISPEE
jgi:hypothetical protein